MVYIFSGFITFKRKTLTRPIKTSAEKQEHDGVTEDTEGEQCQIRQTRKESSDKYDRH